MGRMGVPEELTGVVVLLCGGAGSYINGADFVVDGGQVCIFWTCECRLFRLVFVLLNDCAYLRTELLTLGLSIVRFLGMRRVVGDREAVKCGR